jgi:hypothetical protein
MGDAQIVFGLIAGIVVLFVWGRLPVEIVAIGATVALWATGILMVRVFFLVAVVIVRIFWPF